MKKTTQNQTVRKPKKPVALDQSCNESADMTPNSNEASTEESLDFMWRAFGNLNEWVRFSDTKAATILAANGLIFGALTTAIIGSKPGLLDSTPLLIWQGSMLISSFYSASYALLSLVPQLTISSRSILKRRSSEVVSSEESSSLVFFKDIHKAFPSSDMFLKTIQDSLADPDRAVREIGRQVWANSAIASRKYDSVTRAVYGICATLVIGFAGSIILTAFQIWKRLYGI